MTSTTQNKTGVRSLLEIMPSKECHCHRCGARIAEGDARCAACGKKQQVKNTRLLDFLIAHTKDSITGKITDSIYEAIKNFLLSHLFGVVVSLSLVAAVGVTVYASEPYIERVHSTGPVLSAEQEHLLHELNLVAQELGYKNAEEMLRDQEDWDTYNMLFGEAAQLPNDEPVVEDDIPAPQPEEALLDYEALDHSLIVNLLSDYWYTAFMKPDTTTYDSSGNRTTAAAYLETLKLPATRDSAPFVLDNSYSTNENMNIRYRRTNFAAQELSTDTAQQLLADGVTVGETDVHFTYSSLSDGSVLSEFAFRFVVAKGEDDHWYVAANDLLSEADRQASLAALSGTEAPDYDWKDIDETVEEYVFHMMKGDNEAMALFRATDLPLSTVHQMSGYDPVVLLSVNSVCYPSYPMVLSDITDPADMISRTSKKLYAENYAVAECVVKLVYDVPADAPVVPEAFFLLTMIRQDGGWYVAEDRLLYTLP